VRSLLASRDTSYRVTRLPRGLNRAGRLLLRGTRGFAAGQGLVHTYRVAEDVIELLGALFADLNVRSRGGVVWTATTRHLPLEVAVTPADCPTRSFPLGGAVVADGVVQFAHHIQQWLIAQLSAPVPPCPMHGFALDPRLVGRSPHWVCPQGDFECEFGRYLLALWPPAAYDPEAAPMLAARLHDRGIRFTSVGLAERGSSPIAQVTVFPGEDEASVRVALAPFRVEISSAEAVWTERFTESTPEGTFRGLRLRGGGAQWLAALTGQLDRPSGDQDADVLVDGQSVRLGPEHGLGGPGEPLVLDTDGIPFADVGEIAYCAGGFPPTTGVRGEERPFYAWQIRIKET
jgi:hypothetical protein